MTESAFTGPVYAWSELDCRICRRESPRSARAPLSPRLPWRPPFFSQAAMALRSESDSGTIATFICREVSF